MIASLAWIFGWYWHHGRRANRLELAYRRFWPLVPEIPATSEYIDFEGSPDRLQVTKIGGYPTGLGSEAGGRADIISHIMASFGNGTQAMERRAVNSPPGGISLSHSSCLSVPQHASRMYPRIHSWAIPGPTRGSIPGPGAIPTAFWSKTASKSVGRDG